MKNKQSEELKKCPNCKSNDLRLLIKQTWLCTDCNSVIAIKDDGEVLINKPPIIKGLTEPVGDEERDNAAIEFCKEYFPNIDNYQELTEAFDGGIEWLRTRLPVGLTEEKVVDWDKLEKDYFSWQMTPDPKGTQKTFNWFKKQLTQSKTIDKSEILKDYTTEVRKQLNEAEALKFYVDYIQPIRDYFTNKELELPKTVDSGLVEVLANVRSFKIEIPDCSEDDAVNATIEQVENILSEALKEAKERTGDE